MKVGEAQQMEEGLRRELARVGRDIEVAIIVIVIIINRVAKDIDVFHLNGDDYPDDLDLEKYIQSFQVEKSWNATPKILQLSSLPLGIMGFDCNWSF